MAQLGLLSVLESEGLIPDLMVGTSGGALVGALVALYGHVEQAVQKIREVLNSPSYQALQLNPLRDEGIESGLFDRLLKSFREQLLIARSVTNPALVKEEAIQPLFEALFGDHTFEDLKIPLAAVALDLHTGETVVLRHGPLIPALRATSSIPGVFPPVVLDGRVLVDAGPTDVVPVWVAQALGAETVVAVDVSATPEMEIPTHRAIEIMLRAEQWASYRIRLTQLHTADLVIQIPVEHISWDEFDKLDQALRVGREVGEHKVSEIRRIWSSWYRWKKRILHPGKKPPQPPVPIVFA